MSSEAWTVIGIDKWVCGPDPLCPNSYENDLARRLEDETISSCSFQL